MTRRGHLHNSEARISAIQSPAGLPEGAAQDDIQEGEKDDIQNAPRAGQVPSRRRHGAGQCAFMCAGTIIKLCG